MCSRQQICLLRFSVREQKPLHSLFGGGKLLGLLVFEKKYNFSIAFCVVFLYTRDCCDMIAKKREVAIPWMGFPWSECQETATNDFAVGKPDDKSLYVA